MKPIIKLSGLILILSINFFNQGCKQPSVVKHDGEKDRISFKPIFGSTYTEISRRTANGLSFNNYGYQLEPQWQMNFVSDDSVSIYSPTKGRFINFPLTRGYDSVFNTARTWLKVKKMNKDSLRLEVLEAYGDSVDTKGVRVFMTFYNNDYIKNTLHSDTGVLRRPSRKDSLYVRSLSTVANKDYKKAFSAREPVVFTSKSPNVKVKKWITEGDMLNHFSTSDDYMNPTYDIAISKAYANFYYSFTVFVTVDGQMYYGKPLIPFFNQSFKDNYLRLSHSVMDSYLKYYLQVIPGKTLGMPHASEVNVHVEGKTGI
ncbi:hypothetical protein [Mucilaginibacter sp.]|uniref:hypothetical protein n=1 Tax=Mucilaginibacter sp. TaxID=1882438 RepID=UPI0025E5F539|nr:hypothetical protein [Mucilaginibacter sp.]